MSDQRASIKIEFVFHGKTYNADMWVNYFADSECEGVDQRVIDFFRKVYEDGIDRYDDEREEDSKRATEEREMQELKRLKEKYEPAT